MTSERSKIMDNLIAQDADLIDIEPVAYRYGFDGYGWQYIDSGSGSDWAIRHTDAEPLYAHSPAHRIEELSAENERLRAERDTPHVSDFLEAVKLEAAHQRERWGSDHDAGKTPFDWFWLIGYLAQKAADAATRGDAFKALHHTISTAATLANWHSAMAQVDNTMHPGIVPDDEAQARAALGEKQ